MSDDLTLSPKPVGGDEQVIEKQEDKSALQTPSTPPGASDLSKRRRIASIFGPICGSNDEYKELFTKEGFGDFTDLNILEKYGFARFSTQEELDRFIQHFNQFEFKGRKMYANQSTGGQDSQKNYIRTLRLADFGSDKVRERDIYDAMCHLGFVRRITKKQECAFVEFDTCEGARDALAKCKDVKICGAPFHADFARTERHTAVEHLTIPLREILPEDHVFWYRLQDLLYEK